MIELTVYNTTGEPVDTIQVDESVLGGCVRYSLLKQAIVMYHANKRVGTVATKSRAGMRQRTAPLGGWADGSLRAPVDDGVARSLGSLMTLADSPPSPAR